MGTLISLWENRIRDNILSHIYLINTRVQVTIRTPIGKNRSLLFAQIPYFLI